MPETYTTLAGLFTAIADALRARSGGTDPIAAQSFPSAIAALPSGGTDTSDATAAASDILAGKTAYGAAGTKLTGTVPSLAAATITPGAAAQTIAAGQYLAGAQTVAGDQNLTAANIRAGVSVFGVAGSLADLKLAPTALNVSGGYLYNGTWRVEDLDTDAADVYPVTAGRCYVAGLGATVGNRFRAAWLPVNPAGATENITGTTVGSDNNNPSPYDIKPVFIPADDGYLVIFKCYDGTGPSIKSYVLDVTALV